MVRSVSYWLGGAAAVCLCTASAFAQEALTLQQEVLNGAYIAGTPVDIALTVDYTGTDPATAIAITETLPEGWVYDFITDTPAPPDVTILGSELLFNFLAVPQTPFTFTFRVDVPADAAGAQLLLAEAMYRLSAGVQKSPVNTATISPAAFMLTVSVNGPGTVLPMTGTIPFVEPDGIILEAVPTDNAYMFFRWAGLNSSRANPLPLYVPSAAAITAEFTPKRTIDIAVIGEGTVTPGSGNYTYPQGDVINIEAIAAAGWHLDHWQGLRNDAVLKFQTTITASGYYIAYFAVDSAEGEGEGEGEGATEGEGEGATEGEGEGEGASEGEGEGEGEGASEGEGEGEGAVEFASGDQNQDHLISMYELLRAIQFYNSLGYHCAQEASEDGYEPGPGPTNCAPNTLDYEPQDWVIQLAELLRLIQFYNSLGYYTCEGSEDGFCAGPPPAV